MSSLDVETNDEGSEAPPRKSKRWRTLISIVTLSILAWLGRPYYGELDKVWHADLGFLAAVLVVSIVTRLISLEIFVQTVAGIGCLIPRGEGFWLLILRAYSSLFIPRGGFGTTGYYLKKRYGVRYASYTALLMPIGIVQCLVIGLLGLGALWTLQQWYGVASPPVIKIVFACSSLFSLLALLVRFRLPDSWSGKLAHFLRGFTDAWNQLSRNRLLLLKLVLLHTAGIGTRAFRLYLGFYALGVEVNLWGVVIASLLADLAFIFSFTPAGLGFRETAIWFGASLSGATKDEALAAALLDRLVMVGTLVILAQISLWKMPGVLKKSEGA